MCKGIIFKMSSRNFLRLRGNSNIRDLTLEELATEPLPNKALHYVQVILKYDGFDHKLFFSPSDPPSPSITGPHIVLQQAGKARSLEEIEVLGGSSYEVIKNPLLDTFMVALSGDQDLPHRVNFLKYTGAPRYHTNNEAFRGVAEQLRLLIGAAPLFEGYFDRKTGLVKDASSDIEIYGSIDLQNAIYRGDGPLTQREIARYVLRISESGVFQNVSLRNAHYKGVSKWDFRTMDPTIREKADFF